MADILRNDFKPFAVNAESEVMSQNQWDEGTLRRQGHVAGLASQFLANKAERQGTLAASSIGELINRAGLNAVDDGNPVQLANTFQAAVIFMALKVLFDTLAPTAPDDKPVLIGYDPVTRTLFGYPLGDVVGMTDHLRGGDPGMGVDDYPNGRVSGGNPGMAPEDYTDGRLSGGNPLTL
jgi:hypothetical protein